MSNSRKLGGSPPALFMTAIILCDDLAFTARAESALARVGGTANVNVRWTTIIWPINALNEGPLAEKALVEALEARLILFPARCAQSLPHWVFGWLGRWAKLRSDRDAAIGIMCDYATDVGKPTPPELFRFVRKHGLNLIVDEQQPLSNPRRVFAVPPIERDPVPPLSDGSWTAFVSKSCYRAFGINE